jgi:hypothetical protein
MRLTMCNVVPVIGAHVLPADQVDLHARIDLAAGLLGKAYDGVGDAPLPAPSTSRPRLQAGVALCSGACRRQGLV